MRWTDWEGATLSITKLLRHPRYLRTYAVKIELGNILVSEPYRLSWRLQTLRGWSHEQHIKEISS